MHQGEQGHPACGRAVVLQWLEVQGLGLWREDGSSTWQSEQNFSTPRESWTQLRCFSLAPAEGTELAACIFAVFLMPGGFTFWVVKHHSLLDLSLSFYDSVSHFPISVSTPSFLVCLVHSHPGLLPLLISLLTQPTQWCSSCFFSVSKLSIFLF